jgi:hypothetical protein
MIPDMGTIYKMLPVQSSMMVFASNGVWAISGSQGLGFTANDYSIRKISSVGAMNETSFADIEGFAIWWNLDGIYTLSTDNVGNFGVESISDTTIKTFYANIPPEAKRYAKAAYNERTKVVQWIYRSTSPTTVTLRYTYNRVLNFNLLTKAFYPWTISDGKNVIGLVNVSGFGTSIQDVDVTDSTDAVVQDVALHTVQVTTGVTASFSSIFKYIVAYGGLISIAETNGDDYLDWTETDYDSYFVTGAFIAGETDKYFQANYVNVFMDEELNASIRLQGRYDFTGSSSTGKWSSSQQAYNSNQTGWSTRVRRLKVRGKGRAIQLYFRSETGKPFTVLGWSTWYTGNNGL